MILRLLLLRLEGASLTILQARYVSGVVAESATTQTVIVWKLQNMAYAGTGELASQEGADLCGENKDEEDEGSGTAVDDEQSEAFPQPGDESTGQHGGNGEAEEEEQEEEGQQAEEEEEDDGDLLAEGQKTAPDDENIAEDGEADAGTIHGENHDDGSFVTPRERKLMKKTGKTLAEIRTLTVEKQQTTKAKQQAKPFEFPVLDVTFMSTAHVSRTHQYKRRKKQRLRSNRSWN